MAFPWSDNFSSGGNWTQNGWTIGGGVFTAANATAVWNKSFDAVAEGPDYYVQAKVTKSVADTTTVGLIVKYHIVSGTASYYLGLIRTAAGTDTLEIWKNVGGSFTQLGSSTSLEWTNGDILRFEINKTSLKLYSAPAADPTNFTEQVSVTDSTFSVYIPGTIAVRSTSTTATLDDLEAGLLTDTINLCHVTLGALSSTTAKIGFRTGSAATVKIKYSTASDLSGASTTAGFLTASTEDFTGVIRLAGLTANTQYYWTILLDDVEKVYSSYPSFTTFPADGDSVSFKFAFGSCISDGDFGQGDEVFSSIVSKTPRWMFCLGDNVYMDQAPIPANTAADFRAKYKQSLLGGYPITSYSLVNYIAARKAFPWLYMWDDHELTNDFDGGTSDPIYANAKARFQDEFLGLTNPDPTTAGELYYSFQYGNVGFFVTDTRSFRSDNNATDNSSKTILGATQKAALKSWLLTNSATFPIKIIAASTTVSGYGTTANDSWGTGFTTELNEIQDYIKDNQIPGVLWITADQHWSGIFKNVRNGVNRYEIMASPLKQIMLTKTSSADAAILYKDNDNNNFGVVTIDTTVSPATISLALYNYLGVALTETGYSQPVNITENDLNEGLGFSGGGGESIFIFISA